MSTQSENEQPMDPGDEVVIAEVMEPGALAVHITAEIDVQIATAKQYPRNMTTFKRTALSLATANQEVAESCTYGLPRAKTLITGPSVRLAEIIYYAWGNIRLGARVIMNDGKAVTAQGICHDLERNICSTVEIRRSILQHEYKWDAAQKKSVKTGRMVPMTEDMQIVTGNAACSIAKRNALFSVVPKAVWSEVWDQAQNVAKGDAATLPDRRRKAMDFFNGKGIKDDVICRTLGVQSLDDIDLDILAQLSAMKSALVNKELTLEALFPPIEDTSQQKSDKATDATKEKINKPKTGGGAKATLDKLKTDLAQEKKEE